MIVKYKPVMRLAFEALSDSQVLSALTDPLLLLYL